MAEQRFGHTHTRSRASGPEYLAVPTRNLLLSKNGYYSEDDKYDRRSPPVVTSTTPRIPSPPASSRRRSFGDAMEPGAIIPYRERDHESQTRESIRSNECRVPSPPNTSRRNQPLEGVYRIEDPREKGRGQYDYRETQEVSGPSNPHYHTKTVGRSDHDVLEPSPRSLPPPERRQRLCDVPRSPWPNRSDAPTPQSDSEFLSAAYRQRTGAVEENISTGLQRSKSDRTPSSHRSTPTSAEGEWTRPQLTRSTSSSLGDRTYQYRSLDYESIRLINVLPERKTMIKCEIIQVPLEQLPRYVAISYAWGDPGDTCKIDIGGNSIPISVSLHGALQALRQKNEPVLVWADALCIDQGNRDERTQQIQLMPNIYSNADSVAVWLGAEGDDSAKAVDFIRRLTDQAKYPKQVSRLLASGMSNGDLAGVVSLFGRDYWRRLWVVQELLNANEVIVYCGSTKLPWRSYQLVSELFFEHRHELAFQSMQMNRKRLAVSPDQFSYDQVLIYQGPASLPDLRSYMEDGEGAFLEILRACRRKLASDPRDKIFGILGVLPKEVRNEFPPDYNLSVKDLYTEVVDFLIKTTQRLDVICEAIHFPVHTSSADLPSFIPDWSHSPQTASMGHRYNFSAAGSTKARCTFLDQRLNKLEIEAIPLDSTKIKGVAVGTLCNLGDYLMAFLHWRALLLGEFGHEKDRHIREAEEDFVMAICLEQIPSKYTPSQWLPVCYNVFANLLQERLPYLSLDPTLMRYLDAPVDIEPKHRREYLQKGFGDKMMGRSLCITESGRIRMGSGFMQPGDQVVVPLGCSTPILLRPDAVRISYRFVGDVYITRYMNGEAVEHLRARERSLMKYVLQ
ncbi:unnamed protein product [Clonostachys solani]|uniref:Heterokaryon incompatibility domain-containing protein n=1 Tax=Clonostachys solani TaxID=160281 RepID=A0A9N9ZMY4_9HYPO|nr:unnamed protein product [Clonostachys solani]